jgi:hypothetical protein
MGLLTHVLGPSGLTHGRSPCSSLLSLGDLVPMVPNLVNRVVVCQSSVPSNELILGWEIRLHSHSK